MYYEESDFLVVERVVALAERSGFQPTQVALAWLLQKPGVTAPIIGASKIPHLDQSIEALEIKLSPEDVQYLEEPYQPHPVLGHR